MTKENQPATKGDLDKVSLRIDKLELGDSAEANAERFAELMTEVTAKEGVPAHPAPGTIVGRWAGDEVYLIGDYDTSNLYDEAYGYRNISRELVDEWNDFIELKDMQLKYNPECNCQKSDDS